MTVLTLIRATVFSIPASQSGQGSRGRRLGVSRYRVLSMLAFIVVAFALAATAAVASLEPASTTRPRLQYALDRLIASGVPGAVVLARDGNRTITLAGGYGNLKQKTPTKATDRFRVGSITKTFVATVVLQLVGENKLGLDDTIEQWLPSVVPNGKSITVRQLLNMTSGLFDYLNDGDTTVDDRLFKGDLTYRWSPLELIAISNAHKPRFTPGTGWSYCSTCYVLLGLMVEKSTGNPLGTELRRRVFVPARLRSTSFDTQPRIAGPHAHGYERVVANRLTDVSVLSPSYGWAAGAVVSNAGDLARFYRALLGGRLLRPDLLRAMESRVRIGSSGRFAPYGLGLFRSSLGCGVVFGHAGSIAGYEAHAYSSKDGRRQAVVLVSLGSYSQSKRTASAIESALATAYCTKSLR
jgi:D-alanyl-D-alanine carboxypeptidase